MNAPDNCSLLDDVGLEFLGKIAGVLGNAQMKDFALLTDMIQGAPRVFICGAGRSGLVGRFFAMRLMHLGGTVYVVGDTTTPAAGRDDLVICISGSGTTQTIVNIALLARQAGAKVASISLQLGRATPLGEQSDLCILLDRRVSPHLRRVYAAAPTIHPAERHTLTPMGTVFEISTLVYLEAIVAEVIRRQQIMESEMKLRHANLE